MDSKKVMGRELMLYTGDGGLTDNNIICLMRNCTLTISGDKLETTGPGGPWKRYIYNSLGATITGDGVVSYGVPNNVVQIQEQLIARRIVNWKFTAFHSGGLIYSGRLIWDSVDNSAPFREVSQFSFESTVDGEVSIEKIPNLKVVYLADSNGVRLPGCPNVYPVRIYWYDGTVLGIAYDQADVIGLFNAYPGNTNLVLNGYTTGCDFNLSADWTVGFIPDWIVAEPLNDDLALSDAYINIIGDGDGSGLAPIVNV